MNAPARADASAAPGGSPAASGGLAGAFERMAAARPDAVALTCGAARFTYAELDARANRIAHLLRAAGVSTETLVGVLLERSSDLVAAVLGVLKSGGAYVPLDPVVPDERLAFMAEDAGLAVVLTSGALAARLPAGRTVIRLDDEASLEGAPETALSAASDARHLAYVLYTSGSTGVPKGTLVTQENVLRLFRETEAWFGFSPEDVWTLFHSAAFDFSVWEMWGALLYGGRLVVVPYAVSRDPRAFHALLREEGVTFLNQTPSAFRQLARVAVEHPAKLALRTVVFGGEALNLESLRAWFGRFGDERPRLVNMYGITETTVHVTYRPLSRADLARPGVSPIGVPIPDLEVLLLDADLSPVSGGATGEIFVAGAGLARGYRNRPDLTAARFFAHDGRRVYRSGDLGRRGPDGELEYLGRMDDQVKIRGFRIELGEVETVLRRHPAVEDAAVLAREDAAGEKRLVAWVVLRADADDGASDVSLRAHAARTLPEYMLPSAFVRVAALPLTANGKVDRAALPEPAAERPSLGVAFSAPASGWEERLANVWGEVLRIPRVGRRDNFFDLGGSSLLAVEAHEALTKRFGLDLPVTALFEHPTLEALARLLDARDAAPDAAAGASSAIAERARRQRGAVAAPRRTRG